MIPYLMVAWRRGGCHDWEGRRWAWLAYGDYGWQCGRRLLDSGRTRERENIG